MLIRLPFLSTFAMLATLMLTLSSCSDNKEPEPPKTPRTILVYMAACNSLGSAGYDALDLDEMTHAVRSGDIGDGRLLVYHADMYGTEKLMEIDKEGTRVLKTYSDNDGLSSVHAKRMSQVIDDAKRFAPADSYGLILWSHGLGWLQNGISDDFAPEISAHSWGEERGRTMNITSLENALSGKNLDFVYFDCCYMASIEVVYQLRNVTDHIVASAIELPSEGMPYDKTLKPLFAVPNPELENAARNTFMHYDAKSGEDRTCAISVISTAPLNDIAKISKKILSASQGKTPEGFKPQRFMVESRCWFFDFAQYYQALAEYAGCDDDISQWNMFMDSCVIYAASTPKIWNQLEIKHHCGLSTYIPSDNDTSIKNYNTLDWYKDVIAP